jgi:hypothetical protein
MLSDEVFADEITLSGDPDWATTRARPSDGPSSKVSLDRWLKLDLRVRRRPTRADLARVS